MLQYHEQTEDEAYLYSPVEMESEPDLTTSGEIELIEDYLDRVCAPLVGTIARGKRNEIRERVRQRVNQFTAGHRELGSSDSEAVELALAQCGDPVALSRRWLPERNTNYESSALTGRTQLKLSNTLRASNVGATAISTLAFGLPYLADNTKWSGNWWAAHSDNTITYYRFFLFTVPLLAGLITGLLAKRNSVRGVANAIGLLAIPAIGVPGLVMGLQYAHLLAHDWTFGLLADPLPAVCGVLPWLILGCAGAGLGRRIRSACSRFLTRGGRILRTRRYPRVAGEIRLDMDTKRTAFGNNPG